MSKCLGVTILAVFLFAPLSLHADANADYQLAQNCHQQLQQKGKKSRERWERCIRLFEDIHKKYKGSKRGGDGLYSAARLRRELSVQEKHPQDLNAAIALYNDVIENYPKSTLADDALYHIALIRHDPLREDDKAKRALEALLDRYPNGDMAPKAKTMLATLQRKQPAAPTKVALSPKQQPDAVVETDLKKRNPFREPASARIGGKAVLLDFKERSLEGGTEILFRFDVPVAFTTAHEPYGPRTERPPRLIIDLPHVKRSNQLPKRFRFTSPDVRALQMKQSLFAGNLELRFDLKRGIKYDVSTNGNRLVVRLTRGGRKESAAVQREVTPISIVIDPGHGGEDHGALGKGGAREKDIALEISRKLAEELRTLTGARVYLTRTWDRELSLDDRHQFAVRKKADLFLSIHANASTDPKISGIQTYYLNNASDAAAEKLATRENASSHRSLSEVEHILSTMMQNYSAAQSRHLATDIQTSMLRTVSKKYRGVNDLHVRSALFYVLVGAKCPSVLIETSFISNPKEEKRLQDPEYQKLVAQSIAVGVKKYLVSSASRAEAL